MRRSSIEAHTHTQRGPYTHNHAALRWKTSMLAFGGVTSYRGDFVFLFFILSVSLSLFFLILRILLGFFVLGLSWVCFCFSHLSQAFLTRHHISHICATPPCRVALSLTSRSPAGRFQSQSQSLSQSHPVPVIVTSSSTEGSGLDSHDHGNQHHHRHRRQIAGWLYIRGKRLGLMRRYFCGRWVLGRWVGRWVCTGMH
jgi:hypothetical protein